MDSTLLARTSVTALVKKKLNSASSSWYITLWRGQFDTSTESLVALYTHRISQGRLYNVVRKILKQYMEYWSLGYFHWMLNKHWTVDMCLLLDKILVLVYNKEIEMNHGFPAVTWTHKSLLILIDNLGQNDGAGMIK